MKQILRFSLSIALAGGLCGCIVYGHPYHRYWHAPVYGHPGYWR